MAKQQRMKAKSRVLGLAPFDASEFLSNEEVVAEYLAAAQEDPNPDTHLRAMANVARARRYRVAKPSGLERKEAE